MGPNRGCDAPFWDTITICVRLGEEVVGSDDGVSPRPLRASATVVPSAEYANEKKALLKSSTVGGMAQTRPPVCRSHLNRFSLRKYVKKRLSGEKKRHREPGSSSHSKVLSRLESHRIKDFYGAGSVNRNEPAAW